MSIFYKYSSKKGAIFAPEIKKLRVDEKKSDALQLFDERMRLMGKRYESNLR